MYKYIISGAERQPVIAMGAERQPEIMQEGAERQPDIATWRRKAASAEIAMGTDFLKCLVAEFAGRVKLTVCVAAELTSMSDAALY